MMFYEISAVEGVRVEDAFRELAKMALKRDAQLLDRNSLGKVLVNYPTHEEMRQAFG